MNETYLQNIINFILNYSKQIFNQPFNNFSFGILYILLGFFIATALSTIPGQTGDWGVIAASIIVSFNELISQVYYSKSKIYKTKPYIVWSCNNIKIGIVYGLFVDAFKLGS